MAAVANNPDFAKKAGVPQSVGKDFTKADKGRKFSKGGDMATKKPAPVGGGIETKGKTKGTIVKMARGGGVEAKGKTQGAMIKMKKGGKC